MYLGNKAKKKFKAKKNKRKTIKIMSDKRALNHEAMWSPVASSYFWNLKSRDVMLTSSRERDEKKNKIWTTMRRDQKKMQEDDVKKKAGEESERIKEGRLQ